MHLQKKAKSVTMYKAFLDKSIFNFIYFIYIVYCYRTLTVYLITEQTSHGINSSDNIDKITKCT